MARFTMWSLAGQLLPFVVAPLAIPVLLNGYGIERFGIIALAWSLTGSASIFDLGMGRAVTKLVAERLNDEDSSTAPLVWTALSISWLTGLAGAAAIGLSANFVVNDILRVPHLIAGETVTGLVLIGLSIPLITSGASLRGLLEANQQFKGVNAVRIPMGVLAFIGPVAALALGPHLELAIGSLVAARVIPVVAYFALSVPIVPGLGRPTFDVTLIRTLMAYGGWITVTNVVVPVITYLDRFVIGAVVSIAGVAYYAAPNEIATKLTLLPSALVAVLFPAFAMTHVTDRQRTVRLFELGTKVLFAILFPVTLVIVTFARDGMTLWLGTDFASHSYVVVQILAIGVLFNALAYIPNVLIQAVGRPDWTAKNSLLQFPLYVGALYLLTRYYGIDGAAIAAAARFAIDAFILFVLSGKLVDMRPRMRQQLLVGLVVISLACGFALWPIGLLAKVSTLGAVLLACAIVVWKIGLEPSEGASVHRALLRLKVAGIRRRGGNFNVHEDSPSELSPETLRP